jgi:hypothetical protein
MRVPMYVRAGLFGASLVKFVIVAIIASLIWTTLLLSLAVLVGKALMSHFRDLKWPMAFLLLGLVIAIQLFFLLRQKRQDKSSDEEEDPVISSFELWPPMLFYLPVAVYYLWLSLRHFSLTLPTAVNPSIYSSGLVWESKSQILDIVPGNCRPWLAPYVTLKLPEAQTPTREEPIASKPVLSELLSLALESMNRSSLNFPCVAKPDIGQRGVGVQRIFNEDQLAEYLNRFPGGRTLMLQQLIEYPEEASILYMRRPSQKKGQIFSLTLKRFPTVRGDGSHTLRELILADERANIFKDIYLERHSDYLDQVLDKDIPFSLAFAGNLSLGTIFRDGVREITEELTERIRSIANVLPEFYFGRFDLRFESLEALRRGEQFLIVEINGASSEATHIWDPHFRLVDAYRTLFKQFKILFQIGTENRKRGYRPISPLQLIRDFKAYLRLAKQYPPTH